MKSETLISIAVEFVMVAGVAAITYVTTKGVKKLWSKRPSLRSA